MGWARAGVSLALPILLASSLGGCVETKPLTVSGAAPRGPATYRILDADALAMPLRTALDGQLTQRGLRPSGDETADYYVSLSFADRPMRVGAFAGDTRPAKRIDPNWIEGPVRDGKRERRMMIRFADKTGAAPQALIGTEIVKRRATPAPAEALVRALFAASQ